MISSIIMNEISVYPSAMERGKFRKAIKSQAAYGHVDIVIRL